jgi:hypothetical protein
VKIKVDPMKMNLEEITTKQLDDIVDGWMKFIMKMFRDAREKVMTDVENWRLVKCGVEGYDRGCRMTAMGEKCGRERIMSEASS